MGNETCRTLPVSAPAAAFGSAMTSASASVAMTAHRRSASIIEERSEKLFDVGGDRIGLDLGSVTLDDFAFAIDKELGEVPLDRLGTEEPRLGFLEILVQWRRLRPVDVDLGEQGKRHAKVHLAKRLDVLFASG